MTSAFLARTVFLSTTVIDTRCSFYSRNAVRIYQRCDDYDLHPRPLKHEVEKSCKNHQQQNFWHVNISLELRFIRIKIRFQLGWFSKQVPSSEIETVLAENQLTKNWTNYVMIIFFPSIEKESPISVCWTDEQLMNKCDELKWNASSGILGEDFHSNNFHPQPLISSESAAAVLKFHFSYKR